MSSKKTEQLAIAYVNSQNQLAKEELALHRDWITKQLKDGKDEVAIAMHLINVRKCKAIKVADIRNLFNYLNQ